MPDFQMIGLGFATSILTFSCIWLLSIWATKFKHVDSPSFRKRHGSEVPLVGGLAISIVLFLIGAIMDWLGDLIVFVVGAFCLVGLGALDDRYGLSPKIRLITQFGVVGAALTFSEMQIDSIGLDVFESFESLPVGVRILFTTVCFVGLINAFNMADGIDGLASGYFVVALIGLSFASSLVVGGMAYKLQLCVLIVAVVSFVLVNLKVTRLPKVFLGDSGAYLLGFILSSILTFYSQNSLLHPVDVVWCIPIVIIDTIAVILVRRCTGQAIFTADRRHIHHVIIDHGFNPSGTLLIMVLCSLLLALLGLGLTHFVSPLISLACFCILMSLYTWTRINQEKFLAQKRLD